MPGREPNKEDAPYRPAPRPGDPDYTPPPKYPIPAHPKISIAKGGREREANEA